MFSEGKWWNFIDTSLSSYPESLEWFSFNSHLSQMSDRFLEPGGQPQDASVERVTTSDQWQRHSYPQSIPLLKKWPQGETHVPMVSGHPWARGKCQPNQRGPVFWENVIFSAQGAPRKSWGTYFYVKSKNKWGPLSSLFLILAIKMHFLPFFCYFLPPHHFSCKLGKNAF